MNEAIQINIKITADKSVIALVETLLPVLDKTLAALKATKEAPQATPAAEPGENPIQVAEAPSEPENEPESPIADPGFSDELPAIGVEDCIKAAKEAKARGVPTDAIRATVARFGAIRPQDVPQDKLPQLFDELQGLGASK